MTKPLNPEIKALRAMVRAVKTLPPEAQVSAVDWLHARVHNTTQERFREAWRFGQRVA